MNDLSQIHPLKRLDHVVNLLHFLIYELRFVVPTLMDPADYLRRSLLLPLLIQRFHQLVKILQEVGVIRNARLLLLLLLSVALIHDGNLDAFRDVCYDGALRSL